jgi:predicted phosphoribosyltransferase
MAKLTPTGTLSPIASAAIRASVPSRITIVVPVTPEGFGSSSFMATDLEKLAYVKVNKLRAEGRPIRAP